MIDDDLRSAFDQLADRATVPPDARDRVTRAAGGLRRRRQAVTAAAVLAVVAAAAAPAFFAGHQKSDVGSSAPLTAVPSVQPTTPTPAVTSVQPSPLRSIDVVTDGCTPALTHEARLYGTVQKLYGMQTTLGTAGAWLPTVQAFDGPHGTAVSLCLVVGDLTNLHPSLPPGVADQMHYAVLADSGTGTALISASASPFTSPLPRTPATAIENYVGSATASGDATVPPCVSTDLKAVLLDVGLPDGVVQGAVEISTRSAGSCRLKGDLHMVALDQSGAPIAVPAGGLPGPTDGVYARLPVAATLTPGQAEHQGVLIVRMGNDGPSACAVNDRHTTPAAFRISVGALTVVVHNRAVNATPGQPTAVYGCPSRFYAGAVDPQ